MSTTNVCLVYVTVEKQESAVLIARTVVAERLAACANLLGDVQSFYWWDGAVNDATECALILKTTEIAKDALISRVKQLHDAECPCIVCLPVTAGNPDFLRWVTAETSAS